MLLNARQIDSVQLILLAIGDITERRHAQAELETAHQHTSDILESITDAFYAVDREWRLTFVNRRAEELWEPAARRSAGRAALGPAPERGRGGEQGLPTADARRA